MTDQARVLDMLEDANQYFERSGDRGLYRWKSQFLLGLWHVQLGDPKDSFEYADRLTDASRDVDDLLVLGHAHEVSALAFEGTDGHDDAKSELVAALEAYSDAGFTHVCFAHCLDHTALGETGFDASFALGYSMAAPEVGNAVATELVRTR